MPIHRTLLGGAIVLVGLTMTQPVAAEDEDGERLGRANARALGAYRRAEVRDARSTLSKAARAAKRHGMHGAALARTYANLGVVLAEGAHNHERAVRAFRRALAEDPDVVPPSDLRTPAVMRAFADAASGGLPRADNDNDDDRAEDGEGEADAEADAEPAPSSEPARHVPTPSEVAEGAWRDAEQRLAGPEREPEHEVPLDMLHDEAPHALAAHAKKHAHPRWFVEMGVGVGFSALRQGHAPDRLPESEALTELVEKSHATVKERGHVSEEEVVAHIERELREEGWECDAVQNDEEVRAENCRVASRGGVSVMEPIFDMAFGYHVLPRFAVALTALVQRNHGEGPMAGVLVGLRSEYMLTAPAERGIQLGAIAGLGVGSLQARSRSLTAHAPHATNAGPGGVGASIALGAKGAYRTNQHLSFSMMPLFNIGLPYVLYDMGLTGGVEVAF
ncbi:MAG: hypothetical protein ABW252_13065 [Polyangiales bacterium]